MLHINEKKDFITNKKEDIEFQNFSMNFYVDTFHKILQNHQQYKNPDGVSGLIWNYILWFKPELGQDKCEIRNTPCECSDCTDQLDLT